MMRFVIGLELLWNAVYYVGPEGWVKKSGDDVGELHYKYYPIAEPIVEQEMGEAVSTSWSEVVHIGWFPQVEEFL